ncbi:tripartite tricarboxylate transporter substrate-binding protein [Comamonas endophytica]|uniref:tripartite tricarboxylate transporter substrate-binding protein n=1 Tax=Comamonas endophytica TaxID=2949090 RepID=UPI00361601C4
MNRRHLLKALAAGLGSSGIALNAWARVDQARIYAGYPAGTAVDTLGRQLAERMRPAYANSLVVENKTGASGQLAVLATKAGRADGTTLLVSPISTFSVVPHTFSKVAFDPFSDLIPVGSCTKNDFALAVGPSVPRRSMICPSTSRGARRTRAVLRSARAPPAPRSISRASGWASSRA